LERAVERSAQDDLAREWLAADSAVRQAITRASHRIDSELQFDPESKGESREKGRRILHEAPLGVIFRVDRSSHCVFVLHVWSYD
jgi:predicted RNA polymerase sigma factor